MNYLAHLYLADLNGDSLIGQFLGDLVKGRQMEGYNQPIQAAILFHRKIDTYSDAHPATRISRNRFSPLRRRFAGVIVDMCYDHFLARHWKQFSQETLTCFTKRVYAELSGNRALLTQPFDLILTRMIAYDWLSNYFHMEHLATALDRVAGRLTRGETFKGSIDEVRSHYQSLEQDFHCFFPDLINFSRRYKQCAA